MPCVTLRLTLGSTLVPFAVTGQVEENGGWVYYRSDGSKATDVSVKSDNNWFYLDSNSIMVKSQLVEEDGSYYYMNSAGAMVSSQWHSTRNEDGGGDEPDPYWHYFQFNDKAVKKPGSSDSVKLVTLLDTSGQDRYAFDGQGRMFFGWTDESGEVLTDEDAWKSGLYYCSGDGDGCMAMGWKYITVESDEDIEREGGGHWLYFATNGKEAGDTDSKKTDGYKRRFGENGTAHFEWYNDPGTASGSSIVSKFYSTEEQCWMSTGRFKAVSDKDVGPEGHEEDEMQWYYADSSGGLAIVQTEKINGQSYGFGQYGKMLHRLYRIKFKENGKIIRSAEKIESMDQLSGKDGKSVCVYYFGDSPKEGAVKTGIATTEIDGDRYYYSFSKAGSKKGAGVNGVDSDSIFIEGRRIEAKEGSKYQPVTYKDGTCLVNIAGKLIKNEKNIKDSSDVYYKTDNKGKIVDSGDEKLS